MHKKLPPFGEDNIVESSLDKSIYYLGDCVKSEAAFSLGAAARDATAAEILTRPKPGLVDPLGSGCHSDMDWQTLLVSASALAPFWPEQAQVGIDGTPPKDAMRELRARGMKMDTAMFAATNGINAHKGLVYAMSLILYGAGYTLYTKMELTAGSVVKYAALAARGSVKKELRTLSKGNAGRPLSNGEKLFLKYGVTGIRGEAERAFPSITEAGLPELRRALENGADINDASLCALLAIMEVNEDSNVIHRGGFDFWQNKYKRMVAETKNKFVPNSAEYAPLEELERKFLSGGVSPGGAADLLACTLFLELITIPACQQ